MASEDSLSEHEREALLAQEVDRLKPQSTIKNTLTAAFHGTRKAASGAFQRTRKAANEAADVAARQFRVAKSPGGMIRNFQESSSKGVQSVGKRIDEFREGQFYKAFPYMTIMFTAIFRAMLFVFSRYVLNLRFTQTMKEIEYVKQNRHNLDPYEQLTVDKFLLNQDELNELHQSFIDTLYSDNPNYDWIVAMLTGVHKADPRLKDRYASQFIIEELINLGFDTQFIDTATKTIKKGDKSDRGHMLAILDKGMVNAPLLPMHMIYSFVLHENDGRFQEFLDLFEDNPNKMAYLQERVPLEYVNSNYAEYIQDVNRLRFIWKDLKDRKPSATNLFKTRAEDELDRSRQFDFRPHGSPPPVVRYYPTRQGLAPIRRDADGNRFDPEGYPLDPPEDAFEHAPRPGSPWSPERPQQEFEERNWIVLGPKKRGGKRRRKATKKKRKRSI